VTKRLTRWVTYSVLFALIPLISALLLRFFADKLSFAALSRSPELLFFSLMLNATSLGDLTDVSLQKKHHDMIGIFRSAFLIGAVVSSILYGSLLVENVFELHDSRFTAKLFWVSIGLAILSGILGTTAQVFLARAGK
jgi:MFS family permease